MRRLLQIIALVLALPAILVWLATGANCGWTKTSVPVKSVDEVTGLEAINYQRRFVLGIDFLGGVLLGAGMLGGASVMLQNNKTKKTTIET